MKETKFREVFELYKSVNEIRRFREVKDGLWIYPKEILKGYSKFKGGIFINLYDYDKNKEYTLKTFLIECDDNLRNKIELKESERE